MFISREGAMSRQYSIAEAREKLAHVIQEAEQGAKVELTRRGKPVAILLSLNEYERLSRKRGSFWKSYQEFRRKYNDLDVETADTFADVRDPSPGRDFSW
jgi:prevent-host-death family protein